ncbi:MAG: enolase C-terminal domain-like protein [Syntrophorhabdaceae bacterium]
MADEIIGFEIMAIDLPFRNAFRHAAKERRTSESIILKCIAASGHFGFGETLPRVYVTGESRDDSFDFLRDNVLPGLIGRRFSALSEIIAYLEECDGQPPGYRPHDGLVRTASWCAVDLALLDTFGKVFRKRVTLRNSCTIAPDTRYSAVVSASQGWALIKTLIKIRAFGFRQVKLKMDRNNHTSIARRARQILGKNCDIRVDANMDWAHEAALRIMPALSEFGITCFEQPLSRDDIAGAAHLVKETRYTIMADESFHDRKSLDTLIEHKACNAVNVRLSKCGGLVASHARCNEASQAGLIVEVGCQVGETSLLSAAELELICAFQGVRYIESAFGEYLLKHDPCDPAIRFGYGGRPPGGPVGYGFGINFDERYLRSMASRCEYIGTRMTGDTSWHC